MSKMKNEVLVAVSKIGNTYGCLALVESGGRFFLKMEDCLSPDFYGPLTMVEIEAFVILANVPEYGPKE